MFVWVVLSTHRVTENVLTSASLNERGVKMTRGTVCRKSV